MILLFLVFIYDCNPLVQAEHESTAARIRAASEMVCPLTAYWLEKTFM